MKIIACGFLLFAFLHASAQAQADPAGQTRVLILTTGGTIASPADAPRIEGPVLVQAIPELSSYASIEVEQFSLVGSSKLTPTHWLGLARRINTLFSKRPDLAGIVVTHGTDTMEETAYFLNLTVKSDRPVILTGSMRSTLCGWPSANKPSVTEY